MKIAVLKETRANEKRVAATPETVKKFITLGALVAVERGAGLAAAYMDEAYSQAGAALGSLSETLSGADLVIKVQAPEEPFTLPEGCALAALLNPHSDPSKLQAYADRRITALALEFIPRITRAQSMDVLSSQSNL